MSHLDQKSTAADPTSNDKEETMDEQVQPFEHGFYQFGANKAYYFRHHQCSLEPRRDGKTIPAWMVGESPVAHNDRYHGIVVHQLEPLFLAHWAIGGHADARFYAHPDSTVRISEPLPIGKLAATALKNAQLRSEWMEEALAAVGHHRGDIRLFWPEPDVVTATDSNGLHLLSSMIPPFDNELPADSWLTRIENPQGSEG